MFSWPTKSGMRAWMLFSSAAVLAEGRTDNKSDGVPATLPGGGLTTLTHSGRRIATLRRTGAVFMATGLRRDGSSALVNGGFFNGLAGWSWSQSDGGSSPGQVFVGAGQAVMLEGDSFVVTLEQRFHIPGGAVAPAFDLTDHCIRDAFEVTVLNERGNSAVPTWDPLASSFFNTQETDSPASTRARVRMASPGCRPAPWSCCSSVVAPTVAPQTFFNVAYSGG